MYINAEDVKIASSGSFLKIPYKSLLEGGKTPTTSNAFIFMSIIFFKIKLFLY